MVSSDTYSTVEVKVIIKFSICKRGLKISGKNGENSRYFKWQPCLSLIMSAMKQRTTV